MSDRREATQPSWKNRKTEYQRMQKLGPGQSLFYSHTQKYSYALWRKRQQDKSYYGVRGCEVQGDGHLSLTKYLKRTERIILFSDIKKQNKIKLSGIQSQCGDVN